jgi:hypothetical protein
LAIVSSLSIAANWQRELYFSQSFPNLALPFYLLRTRGDGVAHTRTREA